MIPTLHRMSRVGGAAMAILLAAASLLSTAGAGFAADDTKVSWSMRPATSAGPDDRSWVEQELDPGESIEDHLAVRNLGSEAVTFRLSAADGYFTAGGRFNMLPSSRESVAAGTWITVAGTVRVEAGGTVVVPFTTTVPDAAEPGDHAAGIAASVMSEQTGENGTAVGVESRIGFRVMTRVSGDLAPGLSLQNTRTSYDMSWNPFMPGKLTVTTEANNSGNVRLQVDGGAQTQGRSSIPEADNLQHEMLPGDTRTLVFVITDVWPTFFLGTDIQITPTMVTVDGARNQVPPETLSVTASAIPVSQLLVLAGISLLVFSAAFSKNRSRRRTADLIKAARREGLEAGAQRARDATHEPAMSGKNAEQKHQGVNVHDTD
jgi:hypothetical protein